MINYIFSLLGYVPKGDLDWSNQSRTMFLRRYHKARYALRIIKMQRTPGANATVRRMAEIAREALGE